MSETLDLGADQRKVKKAAMEIEAGSMSIMIMG